MKKLLRSSPRVVGIFALIVPLLLVACSDPDENTNNDSNNPLMLSEASVTLDVDNPGNASKDVVLTGKGDSAVDVFIESTASWLMVSPITATVSEDAPVSLTITANCQNNQSHSGKVRIGTENDDDQPVELTVNLHCWNGPLEITEGGTYQGNWSSDDGAVHAVTVKTRDAVTLENCRLRGRGPSHLVQGDFVRLEVRDCYAFGLRPSGPNYAPPRFIHVTYPRRLVVENNWIEGASTTVYVENGNNDTPVEALYVRRNQVRNIDGRVQAGSTCSEHRTLNPDAAGTSCAAGFVSFNRLDEAEVEIAWNEVINTPFESSQDVILSTINSRGTVDNPIRMHNNFIRGQYPSDPTTEISYGTGIIASDSTGGADAAKVSKHVWVYENQVVSITKGGLGSVGGNSQRIYDNRVVSSGKLQDGRGFFDKSAGGIVVWDCCYNHRSKGLWYDIEVFDNVVGWQNGDGTKQLFGHVGQDHCTVDSQGKSQCYDNEEIPGEITFEDEEAEQQLWQKKVNEAGVILGPRG